MIHFFTIVLDGMPWITHHLPVFHRLPCEWDWTIIEGVAAPVKDTAWCRSISPRLSLDGTHEYLQSLAWHPRVLHISRLLWHGKSAMCNAALQAMKSPGLLWQVDADEIWDWQRIMWMVQAFENSPSRNCADFYCRQFLGPNIVVDRIPGTWSNEWFCWSRVWKFEPGMQFATHEPPVILGQERRRFSQDECNKLGIEFDHYAYATEAQVRFKQEYYGYEGAVDGWRRLQENHRWPVFLRDFLPWIKDGTTARPLYS